jgi:hypothetical protein
MTKNKSITIFTVNQAITTWVRNSAIQDDH